MVRQGDSAQKSHQVGDDAEAEQRLMGHDVGGRGRRIGRYDELILDEGLGEEASGDYDQVQHAPDPCVSLWLCFSGTICHIALSIQFILLRLVLDHGLIAAAVFARRSLLGFSLVRLTECHASIPSAAMLVPMLLNGAPHLGTSGPC